MCVRDRPRRVVVHVVRITRPPPAANGSGTLRIRKTRQYRETTYESRSSTCGSSLAPPSLLHTTAPRSVRHTCAPRPLSLRRHRCYSVPSSFSENPLPPYTDFVCNTLQSRLHITYTPYTTSAIIIGVFFHLHVSWLM